MFDTDKRKFLSVLCHGSIFFGALGVFIGVPVIIYFVSDDPVVKENAQEALNFHLNVWLYGGIIAVLWASLIGIPLAAILMVPFFLFHWLPPIWGLLKTFNNPNEAYRYPFIFRIF